MSGGPFICALCLREESAEGSCPDHEDEPLLDTRSQLVRDYLDKLDHDTMVKTYTRYSLEGGLLGVGLSVALAWLAPELLEIKGGWPVVCIGIGVTAGAAVAKRTFRKRYTRWTQVENDL